MGKGGGAGGGGGGEAHATAPAISNAVNAKPIRVIVIPL
jgi:hypothetical protein